MSATVTQRQRAPHRATPCQCDEGPLVNLDEGRGVRCGHDPKDQAALLRARIRREQPDRKAA